MAFVFERHDGEALQIVRARVFEDALSVRLQHETDHTVGVVFTDRVWRFVKVRRRIA
ncbi:peptide deformylase [Pleomorphomonas sp. JP5]|uniref:peptide deformylase n=1 Tax=Pleomorphomonas sp. JP5 TaxID=2942998 RepID=UPI002044580A|nr:peptide deformylase [Pleomorphomonas sp. JP5]MCM5559864.1 peptide deformylase [Pleomorphomonas sp. JP5]